MLPGVARPESAQYPHRNFRQTRCEEFSLASSVDISQCPELILYEPNYPCLELGFSCRKTGLIFFCRGNFNHLFSVYVLLNLSIPTRACVFRHLAGVAPSRVSEFKRSVAP